MELKKIQIGNKEVMPLALPSGIISTQTEIMQLIADEIPQIGIITTKSICYEPRSGYPEPIITQYSANCFMNAVGLSNPGAVETAKKFETLKIPKDKFLLISIFGKDAEEFVQVAKTLEKYADGFELNLSCPHAKGYGMQLGQDPEMVSQIVKAVVSVTEKPVFAKLTPNTQKIGLIAKAAMDAKAYGITAINTVGPGAYMFDSHYVLSNKLGGMSGAGITPIGIKCVKDIKEAVGEIPIIGMGGIYTSNDIKSYKTAGAQIFGIGTALMGMKHEDMKKYFHTIAEDLKNNTNNAEKLLKTVNMTFQKTTVTKTTKHCDEYVVLETDGSMDDYKAGQFVFAWLPGIGEKPFSILDKKPLRLGFLVKGCFTQALAKLKKGDTLYFRGPYGEVPKINPTDKVVLVGGGSGIAGIYPFIKELKNQPVQVFIGARDKEHIPCLEELQNCNSHFCTNDGSFHTKGLVTDLMHKHLKEADVFINCGPEKMIEPVIEIEKKYTTTDKIYSSLDKMTKCGVGICGGCTDKKGMRTCVEGPFMKNE